MIQRLSALLWEATSVVEYVLDMVVVVMTECTKEVMMVQNRNAHREQERTD